MEIGENSTDQWFATPWLVGKSIAFHSDRHQKVFTSKHLNYSRWIGRNLKCFFLSFSAFFSLDELLNGGLLSGNIIDVCGMSGSGKTQLYTTIALNWAINGDHETFVVDTKGDISGDRINRILLNRTGFDADKRKRTMCNIRIEKCNSPMRLLDILSNLLEQMHLYPKLKFFVIDSLPALWFLFHGNKRSLGNQTLAKLADLLRKLAVEHGIVVLTVNLETRAIVSNSKWAKMLENKNLNGPHLI